MKAIAEDDKRLKFVSLEEGSTPPSGLIEHIKNCWWVTHPKKGLVFWVVNKFESPQCNRNKEIAERIMCGMYPWAEIKFISSAYRRIDPNDYIH